MNILVVEDEQRVQRFLSGAFRAEGHTVETCACLPELHEFLCAGALAPDVILLDRLLKGQDSILELPWLRGKVPRAKIVILSAISDPSEKARALDQGADDYLSKPFSLEELSARIRAVMRRGPESNPPTRITLRNLTIDVLSLTVTVNGERIHLSQKEYSILLLLVQNIGRVYTKFQLLDRIWAMQFDVESNVVEVTIRNLRKKLEDGGSEAMIFNRRNVGYWIEA